ncbi:hypothetical protein LEN26_005690 [Aphanomyces euteiches]|nr:hypothetical protein AeMF1_000287 [Aphanomyces euteiches]KAH9137545.1 hypothetical protein LEN26_005690 [Aphanomyces euteiches]KAH9196857.1 hypothetical protein AeNC1_001171 [Aphanomyces euteiches]
MAPTRRLSEVPEVILLAGILVGIVLLAVIYATAIFIRRRCCPHRHSNAELELLQFDYLRDKIKLRVHDAEAQSLTGDLWMCQVCNFDNQQRSPACQICGTSQGGSNGALNARQRAARTRRQWTRCMTDEQTVVWMNHRSHSAGTAAFVSQLTSTSRSCPLQEAAIEVVVDEVSSPVSPLERIPVATRDTMKTVCGEELPGWKWKALLDVFALPFPSKYAWFLRQVENVVKPFNDGHLRLKTDRSALLKESLESMMEIPATALCCTTRYEFKGEPVLVGNPLSLDDIELVDPTIFKSLHYILENDNVDQLMLTFLASEGHGATEVDLVPKGQSITVTDANKHDYVARMVEHLLVGRVKQQLEALHGLFEVLPPELFVPFDAKELELILCGMDSIDVSDWRANTDATLDLMLSPLLEWFWDIVASLSRDDRVKLLQYTTGASRVPVQGFRGLTSYDGKLCRFNLKGVPYTRGAYPVVHACYNRIDMPLYDRKQQLEDAIAMLLSSDPTGFNIV